MSNGFGAPETDIVLSTDITIHSNTAIRYMRKMPATSATTSFMLCHNEVFSNNSGITETVAI